MPGKQKTHSFSVSFCVRKAFTESTILLTADVVLLKHARLPDFRVTEEAETEHVTYTS